jgi:hypothetical protein
MSPCRDFILIGEAERTECGISIGDARSAILNHNPRRNVVSPVVIYSNHKKCEDFVTSSGLCSCAPTAVTSLDGTDVMDDPAMSTDFVLVGAEVEQSETGVAIAVDELKVRATLPAPSCPSAIPPAPRLQGAVRGLR